MQNLFIKGLVTKTAENKYCVIASTASIDRQGDVIDQNGWLLDNYMKNPVMLWAHDYSELPVAKCLKLTVEQAGLICEFEFASAEANPKAGQIKMLYDEGFMNAVSVGFIPKEQNGNIITKAELLEISFVPVPANQDALRLAMSKGLDVSLVAKDLNIEEEKKPEAIVEAPVVVEETKKEEIIIEEEKKTEEVLVEKAGREISTANHGKLKELHSHIKNACVVLEALLASAEVGNDKAFEEKVGEKVEEKALETAEDKDKLLNARANIILANKNNELAMRVINEFLAKKV